MRPAENFPAGSHWSIHGRTPLDPLGRRDTTVVVMDAPIVRNEDEQYSLQSMEREILKATPGFQGDPFEDAMYRKRAAVATGKWQGLPFCVWNSSFLVREVE